MCEILEVFAKKAAIFSYKNKSFSNFGASHHIATDKKKYIIKYIRFIGAKKKRELQQPGFPRGPPPQY